MSVRLFVIAGIVNLLLSAAGLPPVAAASACPLTPHDMLGPFYTPNAPVRVAVGRGFVLSGSVRSAKDCRPLGEARLEFWLAGPAGQYGDAWRATVIADREGRYRFESHVPPPYSGRPSHIHVRVSAPGHRVLVTQYYPKRGETQARFDLVLAAE